jgi:uncharacterized membrane protein
MKLPTLEHLMGMAVFAFGFILMLTAFFAVLDLTTVIEGGTIWLFFIFGFVLCVAGYMMSRSVTAKIMKKQSRSRGR